MVFDPPSKESDFKTPRFQADVVFVSSEHKDHNGFENISAKEGEPFLINGPGEYEFGGMHIQGLPIERLNSIFVLNFEDFNICYLGVFEDKELAPDIMEAIGDVDILFVSVSANAEKIIAKIEPKIIIPMNYTKKELNDFLKKIGKEAGPMDKLIVKKKDILDKKMEMAVLSA